MPRTAKEIAETGPKEPSEVDVSDVAKNSPESVELANCIARANDLIGQKAEVLAGIQECRELATLLTRTGSGSPEQVQWVRFYLPRKSRKTSEQAADDE
jgi:hypothetical protein